MKKYLMTGVAALAMCGAMTSCSNDFDEGTTAAFDVESVYEQAFITRFGEPAATQDWGFGSGAKAGTRGANPAANMWASFYLVPDPLTPGQKERVYKYFQCHKNLTYTDPGWDEYFMQQVYKGGTDTTNVYAKGNTTENYTSAAGQTVTGSDKMNKLVAVFPNGELDHLFNFNDGTCSTNTNVQDNGTEINDAKHHSDQIQLMTESTTHAFGYLNSEGSVSRYEYTGLVSAATIDAWADPLNIGEKVVDKWDRSFMGFDYEQKIDDAIYAKDGQTQEILCAQIADIPGNKPQYVWDGTKVIPVNEPEIEQPTTETQPITGDLDLLAVAKNKWSTNGGSVTYDNDVVVYTSDLWYGSLNWDFWYPTMDWSSYEKLVIEFEEATPVEAEIVVQSKVNYADLVVIKESIESNSSRVEIKLSGSSDLANCEKFYLSVNNPNGTARVFKIKSMKLISGSGQTANNNDSNVTENEPVETYGEIIKIGETPIKLLSTNANEYAGEKEKLADSDMTITKNYNGQDVVCVNLPNIQELYNQGYLPIANKNLREWVKFTGAADGYFSDWIVCLTKANKVSNTPNDSGNKEEEKGDDEDDEDEGDDEGEDEDDTPDGFICRIIAEDLTVDENSDFDFNDVVFDVYSNGVIVLQAAGGTLPLYVAGHEVHDAFGVDQTIMVNTGWGTTCDPVSINIGGTYSSAADAARIDVRVIKNGQEYELKAPVGKVASKVAVGIDYEWCAERQDIDGKYRKADGTKLFSGYVKGQFGDDWYKYKGK